MKKIFLSILFLSLLIFGFFFGRVALAQEGVVNEEAVAPEVPTEIQQVIEQTAEQAIREERRPTEVIIDTTVQPEDLEVKKAKILPDSPFYGLKQLTRGIRKILTFNPISKAELQLKFTNEKIIEAQQLIEEKGTEKAIDAASNIIEEVNQDFENITHLTDQLKQKRTTEEPRVEKFLDKITDQSFKQQVVIQKLQEQVPEEVFTKIESSRQEHLEKFGKVMSEVAENQAEIIDRLPKIIEAQEGSDFKELKAIGVLKELEEKMPDEIKTTLKSVQEIMVKKLEQQIVNMPQEVRQDKLSNYIEFTPGNPIHQFEALDTIKQNLQSPEMIFETEALKDTVVQKLENQLEQFKNEQTRVQIMTPLQSGSPQDLRTITEIEMRLGQPMQVEDGGQAPVVYQDIQNVRQKAQKEFQERFMENPEILEQDETIQRMMVQPDVIDLKFSQELNQILMAPTTGSVPLPPPSTSTQFIKDFPNQVTNKFVENMEKIQIEAPAGVAPVGGEAGRFMPPIPQGLEVLQELKEKVPLAAQGGIERAIKAQTQAMQEHIIQIDDPAVFERYKQQIEQNPNIKTEIQRLGPPTFFNKMEQRDEEIGEIQKQQQEEKWQKMQEINKEIFVTPPSEGGPVGSGPAREKLELMRQMSPEIQTKIEEFKKISPQTNQPPNLQPIQPQVQPQEPVYIQRPGTVPQESFKEMPQQGSSQFIQPGQAPEINTEQKMQPIQP